METFPYKTIRFVEKKPGGRAAVCGQKQDFKTAAR
jgi:hypothetical protein